VLSQPSFVNRWTRRSAQQDVEEQELDPIQQAAEALTEGISGARLVDWPDTARATSNTSPSADRNAAGLGLS
jgi:hypothetical protein